jgi:hypothetical protein
VVTKAPRALVEPFAVIPPRPVRLPATPYRAHGTSGPLPAPSAPS